RLHAARSNRASLAEDLAAAETELDAARTQADRYEEETLRALEGVSSPNGDSFITHPGFINNPGFRVIAERATLLPRLSEATIQRIRGVREAMATRWDIAPDDIGLIKTHENSGGPSGKASKAVVVYLGDTGLRMGSYEDIMHPADDSEFILDVGDRSYDTRQGMTRSAYLGLWLGSPEGEAPQPFTGFGAGIDRDITVSDPK